MENKMAIIKIDQILYSQDLGGRGKTAATISFNLEAAKKCPKCLIYEFIYTYI